MKPAFASFSSDQLLPLLLDLPSTDSIWVGFSGGADSTALLHALIKQRDNLGASIRAVHFHHGLHPDADTWSAHCRAFCDQHEVPLTIQWLDIAAITDSNIEETARNARYQVLTELLAEGQIYLTAHHADDQAETVFLNLMRGSGAEGLAGIPKLRRLGSGWVARPLLNWTRGALVEYLESNGIHWMEDPSNSDDAFDRNFLRNRVFPLIESRWPGLTGRLNRSARIARSTSDALGEFINQACADIIRNPHRLPTVSLLALKPAMQTLVFRHWLRQQEIPPPPESRLLEFLSQLEGSPLNQAEVCWRDWRVRHHDGHLWLQDRSLQWRCPDVQWKTGSQATLGAVFGRVELQPSGTEAPDGWEVDARRQGAGIRLNPRASRRPLKDCFRQAGIPPWLRESIPILYWDDEPAAIGDWLISDRLRDFLETHDATYCWQAKHPLLRDLKQRARGEVDR